MQMNKIIILESSPITARHLMGIGEGRFKRHMLTLMVAFGDLSQCAHLESIIDFSCNIE